MAKIVDTNVKATRGRVSNPKAQAAQSGVKAKEHPYYDYGKLLSYHGVYNFLAGARGLGKTFGAKEFVLKRYFKTGEQFIYLRRYKSELIARNTFFADIAYKFPTHDFRANGNTFECSPVEERESKKRVWDVIGYSIALSTSQTQKSIAFPRVKTIIFDEFIIEKGAVHYLPAEADVFNNFYSTVDRYQDKTTVLFLANAVSITNPYFIEYAIDPAKGELQRFAGGFIVAHFPNAEDFAASVRKTRFGAFISDTEYAKYAIDNAFADNSNDLVDPKSSRSRYLLTIEAKLGIFSVWSDAISGIFTIQARRPGNEVIVTLLPERMSEGKTLMAYSDKFLGNLRGAYRSDRMRFDTPATRNAFIDVFNRK